jgi:hypothetical protein
MPLNKQRSRSRDCNRGNPTEAIDAASRKPFQKTATTLRTNHVRQPPPMNQSEMSPSKKVPADLAEFAPVSVIRGQSRVRRVPANIDNKR